MFGYIAPRLDQLTPEQRSRYQAVYCGLCLAWWTLSGRGIPLKRRAKKTED